MSLDSLNESSRLPQVVLGYVWLYRQLKLVVGDVSVSHHSAIDVAVLVLDQPGFDKNADGK
jgi:hypothetical protein